MARERLLTDITEGRSEIDLDYWRHPEGVEIPNDELKFLLIPDRIESAMVFDLVKQVHEYQHVNEGTPAQIRKAVMVTMGGLLPGVLLYDHLAWLGGEKSEIEFGTVGVKCYEGPGVRLEKPIIVQDVSIDIAGATTLAIDDLGDNGITGAFVRKVLEEKGALEVLGFELYTKPDAKARTRKQGYEIFSFGEVPQNTWIITPRELVETLIKRVPYWQENGASYNNCQQWLKMIGYPDSLINYYLPQAYQR